MCIHEICVHTHTKNLSALTYVHTRAHAHARKVKDAVRHEFSTQTNKTKEGEEDEVKEGEEEKAEEEEEDDDEEEEREFIPPFF
mgnify:CR=1 FL=1